MAQAVALRETPQVNGPFTLSSVTRYCLRAQNLLEGVRVRTPPTNNESGLEKGWRRALSGRNLRREQRTALVGVFSSQDQHFTRNHYSEHELTREKRTYARHYKEHVIYSDHSRLLL